MLLAGILWLERRFSSPVPACACLCLPVPACACRCLPVPAGAGWATVHPDSAYQRCPWVPVHMKLMRGAAAFGAAKMVYDQARKPENQAKLRSAVEKVRESRRTGSK